MAQTTPSPSRLVATAGWFKSNNPVLGYLEPGIESDTEHVKIGDGVTKWNALSYAGATAISGSRGSATVAVLQALITACVNAGIVIDNTTA